MSKTVYRLPPCPDYDTAMTESWLEHLAQSEGLFLTRDGFFMGLGFFEQGTPRRVRYRLAGSEQPTGILADNGGDPDPDMIELSSEMGWEYCGYRGDYHIYRADDAGSVELSTDPEVEAITVEAIKKRRTQSLHSLIFWGLMWPLLRMSFAFLQIVITLGTWRTLMVLAFMFLSVWGSAKKIIHTSRLLGRLRSGLGIEPVAYNEKKHRSYLIRRALWIIFTAATFFCLIHFFFIAEREQDYAEYTGELPFPDIVELAEGTGFKSWFANDIVVTRDPIAPLSIELDQSGDVLGGKVFKHGGLDIAYYELCSPLLSKPLAKEIFRFETRHDRHLFSEDEVVTYPIPEGLDVDYAIAYRGTFQTIVMAKGSKVIRVCLYATGENGLDFDHWASIYAESIR